MVWSFFMTIASYIQITARPVFWAISMRVPNRQNVLNNALRNHFPSTRPASEGWRPRLLTTYIATTLHDVATRLGPLQPMTQPPTIYHCLACRSHILCVTVRLDFPTSSGLSEWASGRMDKQGPSHLVWQHIGCPKKSYSIKVKEKMHWKRKIT